MSLNDLLSSSLSINDGVTPNKDVNSIDQLIPRGSVELTDVSTIPLSEKWYLPILYNLDPVKGDRVWMIGFNGVNLFSIHGLVSGKKQYTTSDVTLNNSGKNMQQQAHQDARTKWLVKNRTGYRVLGVDSSVGEGQNLPMLAQKFRPTTIPVPGT